MIFRNTKTWLLKFKKHGVKNAKQGLQQHGLKDDFFFLEINSHPPHTHTHMLICDTQVHRYKPNSVVGGVRWCVGVVVTHASAL